MKKTYFLYLVLFIAVLVYVMIVVGCVGCFLDIGSLLMVLLCTLFMLKANYSFGEMGRYFSCAFSCKNPWIVDIKNGIIFFKTMQKYLFISGGLGVLMGMIGMLAMLEDPNKIGAGMALALITVLYSLFFNMAVAIPFKIGLEKQLVKTESAGSE
jgi:hypothetical protein